MQCKRAVPLVGIKTEGEALELVDCESWALTPKEVKKLDRAAKALAKKNAPRVGIYGRIKGLGRALFCILWRERAEGMGMIQRTAWQSN